VQCASPLEAHRCQPEHTGGADAPRKLNRLDDGAAKAQRSVGLLLPERF
jgi:hypothetical protein